MNRRLIAAPLSFILALLSPGLAPYEAFAQTRDAAPAPTLSAPLLAPSTLSPSAPALAPSLAPTIIPSIGVSEPSLSRLRERGGVRALLQPAKARSSAQLTSAVGELNRNPRSSAETLSNLYGETRRQSAALNADEPGPSLQDPLAGVPLTIDHLIRVGSDAARPEAHRRKAIKILQELGSPRAQDGLRQIAAAHPDGDALEYEIHRAALAALAELGEVVSLRPISAAHKEAILAGLRAKAPSALEADYDDTLRPYKQPADAALAVRFKGLEARRVDILVNTDRPDQKKDDKNVTIVDSFVSFSPDLKRTFVLAANRGARLLIFDRDGAPLLLREEPQWSDAEKEKILEASRAVAERFGRQSYNGREEDMGPYGYARFLPIGMDEATIQQAETMLKAALTSRGIFLDVVGRKAGKPEDPPYLTVSKFDKSLGTTLFRQHQEQLGSLRSMVVWGASREQIQAVAREMLSGPAKTGPGSLRPEGMLVIGDQFFGAKNVDAGMAQGAAGALAISVGGLGDPRLPNLFVWPTKGPEGTGELLDAAAGISPAPKHDGGMNKKAMIGLFLSRTLSISAYILTSTAYPYIAKPILHGDAGLGSLMALGTMAGLATGPLNGLIVSKLSARNAMMVNAGLRGLLALDVPILMSLGYLNFWVMLLSSIANNWLLSTIVTTEGAFMKKLAGEANVTTMNSLLWMNFLALQVLFGLLIGVGGYIAHWAPMTPYLISSIVHLTVCLPLIYFTIPNIRNGADVEDVEPTLRERLGNAGAFLRAKGRSFSALVRGASTPSADKTPQEPSAPRTGSSFREKAAELARGRWKELAALGAAVAAFAVFKTTLPITGALMFWIARTENFRARWSEKNIRTAMLLGALGTFLVYPVQSLVLQSVADQLAGPAGKHLLFSQLMGVFCFGQLITTSSQAQLPSVRVPFTKKEIGLQRVIQAGVLGLAKAWLFFKLFHGALAPAVAGVAAAAGLMALAERLTSKGWIKFFGFGLAGIWAAAFAWGNVPVLMVSFLLVAMFFGPANTSLNGYIQRVAEGKKMGATAGIQQSFNAAAISLGYGLQTFITGFWPQGHAYPGAFVVMGALYAAAGLAFWIGAEKLPGLPESPFKSKEAQKPATKNS